MFRARLTPLIFVLLLGGAGQLRAQASINLSVDLRDAPRKLLHTTEILPVQPGPLTAMSIGTDGVISDVLMGDIAYQAGFGPGMKILAVNGQPFARATLQQALDAAKKTQTPIDFKVDNTGVISDLRLDYHGGQRHPVLERVPNTPDRIAEILQPMSS